MNPRTIFTVAVTGVALCTTASPPAIAQYTRPVPRNENPNTVAEITQEVARVRLQKLGYTNIQLTRNGDYWEATASKGGKPWQIRLHALTGAREEKQVAAQGK
jgi:hypothetical protein